MKMAQVPTIESLYKYTKINLFIDNRDRAEAFNLLQDVKFDDKEEYDIKIQKKRKRKTKDQNAYAWELIGKLAEKLNKGTIEVYRELQHDMHVFEILPVREDAIESFVRAWERGHIGRVCEDTGVSRFDGYHNLKVHYGISDYNKSQMSHFLELLIQECKQQDIPTLTPREIAELERLEEVN